jgi:poly(ribitol-phosphate) beta-N-acetylglucosaminyltransferase
MPKVSVLIPVFEPGALIEPLIASLLFQSMPAGECELVFVDDGSRDGTAERLDALAAEHAHVRALHIPNSGWPGRPRNVGLDAAQGEFVFFADHDDWLDAGALERLYAAASEHAADIVIGKVVGHGGRRTPQLSRVDRHGLSAGDAPLGLLTPHKLFRRALLEAHGLRFPEGEQRLEDHLFTVPAFFAADRISVLVSHPIYHWSRRADGQNASSRRPAPAAHFAAVRELVAMVDERTEPGPVRDRYHRHWYRGKVLLRLSRRDPEYRAQVYASARALIDDCFPPRLDEALAFNLRLRAWLIRQDEAAGLESLLAFESGLRARARVVVARSHGDALDLAVTGRLRRAGRRAIAVVRRGERLLWEPPPELGAALGEADCDVTDALDGQVGIVLRSRQDETEWPLAVTSTTHVPAAEDPAAPVFPRVKGRVRIDPEVAAGGAALPPGRYDVLATISIAGFAAETTPGVDETPFTITVSPERRLTPSQHIGDAARASSQNGQVKAWIARALRNHTHWR